MPRCPRTFVVFTTCRECWGRRIAPADRHRLRARHGGSGGEPASCPTLTALTLTLRQRPALRLEIAGHTDNVGDAGLNLRLSQQRARNRRVEVVVR